MILCNTLLTMLTISIFIIITAFCVDLTNQFHGNGFAFRWCELGNGRNCSTLSVLILYLDTYETVFRNTRKTVYATGFVTNERRGGWTWDT